MTSILLLTVLLTIGQQQNTISSNSPVEHCKFDGLGKVYFFKNNLVVSCNEKLDTLYQYSNKQLGHIHDLDVTNSLRPILFYEDNAQVVILDNTLSAQHVEAHDLQEIDLYQVSLTSGSNFDNGIWFYDLELQQLVKVDKQFKRFLTTGSLNQVLGINDLTPSQLIEAGDDVYLLCPKNGILIFDLYGTYSKTIPIKDIDLLIPQGENLFFVQENTLFEYDQLNFEPIEIFTHNQSILNVRIEGNTLQLVDHSGLHFIDLDK